MALFTRNVTGDDVLALWRHVRRNEPIRRETLIERFYPADPTDPDQSDSRKPLQDAISVLEEADQVTSDDAGYTIAEPYRSANSPPVALLRGFRAQEGDNAAYADVLDALTEQDQRVFDRTGPLVDRMSGRRADVTWNETRLYYWARMMTAIGVVAPINPDGDEDATNLLSMSRPLLRDLLRDAVSPNEPYELDVTLTDLHETYLPVFAGTGRDRVAEYVQRALVDADRAGTIELGQDSDFGSTYELRGSGYNALTLRVTTGA